MVIHSITHQQSTDDALFDKNTDIQILQLASKVKTPNCTKICLQWVLGGAPLITRNALLRVVAVMTYGYPE